MGDTAAGDGWGGVDRVGALTNCCLGPSHSHQERKELLQKVFLVSDGLTSIVTASVTDWGQNRSRFLWKGNTES